MSTGLFQTKEGMTSYGCGGVQMEDGLEDDFEDGLEDDLEDDLEDGVKMAGRWGDPFCLKKVKGIVNTLILL